MNNLNHNFPDDEKLQIINSRFEFEFPHTLKFNYHAPFNLRMCLKVTYINNSH